MAKAALRQQDCNIAWQGLESLEPRLLLSNTFFNDVASIGGPKVAFADMNNDGWTDVLTGSKLYLNNEGQFPSSPSLAIGGYSVLADYDNDGWTDIFDYHGYALYQNNQNGGFNDTSSILWTNAAPGGPVHRGASLGD